MTLTSRFSTVLIALLLSGNAFATKLSFLADLNLPTGTKFQSTDFGGLSGLSYDAATNELRIISDDKSEKQAARFYSARVSVESGKLVITPFSFSTLKNRTAKSFPRSSIDPEGITAIGRRLFVSTEGNGRSDPRVMPGLFEFDRKGNFVAALSIPEKFLPESRGKQTRGTPDNGSFEGLTAAPNGKSLFIATESPLVQDDTPATFEKGATSRILQLRVLGARMTPSAEYAYRVEPNSKPSGAVGDFGNGISEILALNEKELLVVERGTAATLGRIPNHIRIFKATLGGEATNVAGIPSLKGKNVRPVEKELVLDLNSILPELDPEWRSTDNIEGLSFGPTLPNGNRTLFMISDNNFNPLQRTQILAFEIRE